MTPASKKDETATVAVCTVLPGHGARRHQLGIFAGDKLAKTGLAETAETAESLPRRPRRGSPCVKSGRHIAPGQVSSLPAKRAQKQAGTTQHMGISISEAPRIDVKEYRPLKAETGGSIPLGSASKIKDLCTIPDCVSRASSTFLQRS